MSRFRSGDIIRITDTSSTHYKNIGVLHGMDTQSKYMPTIVLTSNKVIAAIFLTLKEVSRIIIT